MTIGTVHRAASVDHVGTELGVEAGQVELPHGSVTRSELALSRPDAAVVTEVCADGGSLVVAHAVPAHGTPAPSVEHLHTALVGVLPLRQGYQGLCNVQTWRINTSGTLKMMK